MEKPLKRILIAENIKSEIVIYNMSLMVFYYRWNNLEFYSINNLRKLHKDLLLTQLTHEVHVELKKS